MEIVNLKRIEPTLDSLVDAFFGRNEMYQNMMFGDAKVNVQELDDKYTLEMILAGYKKDDIVVGIDDGVLTIESKIQENSQENGDGYARFEFKKKSFKRCFRIPEDADVNSISAKHEDGILNLIIPKIENKQKAKKTIDIK